MSRYSVRRYLMTLVLGLSVLNENTALAADSATMTVVAEVNQGACSVRIDGNADFGLNPASLARIPGARITVSCLSDEISHFYTVNTGLHYSAETGRRMASAEGQFIQYGLYADAGNGPELGESNVFGQTSESYVGASWTHQTYLALKQPLNSLPKGSFEDQLVVTIFY
ncbi:SCPU domain-containing protein [Stagnimonas aquatica]|uniref:SCPU domain-containing protein n=1 Tax=Stagnimonas aquatica TaxID=2689987 RepID=A0A3N0VLQ6_9GAMM|nr:spore coat protein U domain-containing protein [Stagnimonas aquatica]ROH93654.1 SCPU domain-containing protein [Stagnimonas aquatica]